MRPTFLLHSNHWWHWSRLAYPRLVVGAHSEAILLQRLQAGHFERGALTLGGGLPPIPRLRTSVALDLDHVTLDGAAAVVARARPGEHKARGGEGGDHRAGGRRLGPLCRGCEADKDSTGISLMIVQGVYLSYLSRLGWACVALRSCGPSPTPCSDLCAGVSLLQSLM